MAAAQMFWKTPASLACSYPSYLTILNRQRRTAVSRREKVKNQNEKIKKYRLKVKNSESRYF